MTRPKKKSYENIVNSDYEFNLLMTSDIASRDKFLKLASQHGFDNLDLGFNEIKTDMDKLQSMGERSNSNCPVCKKIFKKRQYLLTHYLRRHLYDYYQQNYAKKDKHIVSWPTFIYEYFSGIEWDKTQDDKIIAHQICFNYLENILKDNRFLDQNNITTSPIDKINLFDESNHPDTSTGQKIVQPKTATPWSRSMHKKEDFKNEKDYDEWFLNKSLTIIEICENWNELPHRMDIWDTLYMILTKTLMVIGFLSAILLILFRFIEVFDNFESDKYEVYKHRQKRNRDQY